MKIGKALLHQLKNGKLSLIGHPVFFFLVNLELMVERILDSFSKRNANASVIDRNLTAVIKTFERPKELRRLVKSIRRFYPNIKIIVVDDSENPSNIDGVETIAMPFDSGVSAGRQEALKHVRTKYLLLLDDDYVFYRKTILESSLEQMEKNTKIDILGGARVDLPFYRTLDYFGTGLHPTGMNSCRPAGSVIGGFRVQDKVANFYIARTESIKQIGWDERLKRLDHADFFTRAKGKLVTVFNPGFRVLHAQTPYRRTYMRFRKDYEADRMVLSEKYYSR
jgi:glycosyltransferase involved in cell wall biosynthesis